MTSRGTFGEWRRQRAAQRLRRGDGRPLEPTRWWQRLFGRMLYYLDLPDADGRRQLYVIDVWRFTVEVDVHLYLDGRHHASSRTPAAFPVEGGVIEVAMSYSGIRRCHYVADDGTERKFTPDPESAGGRRVRFDREHPSLARWVSFGAVVVIVIGLGVNILQAVEPISQIPPVADNFGTFESPIQLSLWLNSTLAFVAGLAARERALRLRYHPLLD